jgi:hypothetical protein
MKLLGVGTQITVSVTEDELVLLSGCIRETFEAVEDWEFHTRLGFEPSEARLLDEQIHDVLGAAGRSD